MTRRAIIFDFGGTLDGPAEHWADRFACCYEAVGIRVSDADLRRAFGHSTRAAYAHVVMPEFDLRETIEFHVARQFEHLHVDAAPRELVDCFVERTHTALVESRKVLQQLRDTSDVRLGVISNFYGNVARLLDDAEISPLLHSVIDSAVVGVSKPDPAIFALALQGLAVAADDAVYVGDSFEKDIIGAKRAGIDGIWLRQPGQQPSAQPHRDASLPFAEIERLDQLADVLS